MKKNKGFTLVELLAVIVILAVISLVAVPNVVSMLERNKKKQMVLDAKEMLNKYQNKSTLNLTNNTKLSLSELGISNITDGYGDDYLSCSYVEYSNNSYTVVLSTKTHCIKKTGIISSKNYTIKAEDVVEIAESKENNECQCKQ